MNAIVDVVVREVGLRDGLQLVPDFFPTGEKLGWVRAESAAGVSEIEVTSFVPPKLISQFADAEEVARGSLQVPGLTVVALVPNLKGAERALSLGVHKLNFILSVSRTHNLKNVRREREESMADFRRIVALRNAQSGRRRMLLGGGLSTALGCSYEGRVAVDEVRRYAAQYAEAGADEVLVADTVGYGDPVQVRAVFGAVQAEVGSMPVAAHFHDTRGTGLANVAAALACGPGWVSVRTWSEREHRDGGSVLHARFNGAAHGCRSGAADPSAGYPGEEPSRKRTARDRGARGSAEELRGGLGTRLS